MADRTDRKPPSKVGRWKKGGTRYSPVEEAANRKTHEQIGWRNGAKVYKK